MLGRQHLIFGISTATALALVTTGSELSYFESPVLLVAGSALGSLVPDIDTPQSTIGKRTYLLSLLLNKLIGHRTYTHDPIIWIPLAIFLTIKYPLMFGFFFGYIGHLFLDSLTSGGIPICYLFYKKSFHLLPYSFKFKSDSIAAKIVTVFASVVAITLIQALQYINITF